MGLDINALKFLLDSKATGTSFERTVTLGRQGLFIEPEALAELVRRVLPQFTLADAQALLDYAQTDSNVVRLSMWSVARDNGNSAGAHYAAGQQRHRPTAL